MKKIKCLAITLLASTCVFGSDVEALIKVSDKSLEVFSTFYRSIIEDNVKSLETYVRVPEILTDTEKRSQLFEFMQIRKKEFSKLEDFEDKEKVAVSIVSTGEHSFSVTFTSIATRVTEAQHNSTLPVIESWGQVSLGGETVKAEKSYILTMNFKRDSHGWYFHSGNASSVK